jgi:uncharacterized protein YcbK (DUF882 family)
VASLSVAGTTVADPPVSSRFGLSDRKDACRADGECPGDAAGGESAVETLGTLYNTHTGEAMPLSRTEPSATRFAESLADRATGTRSPLDDRLLDLLRSIAQRNAGVRIELVSGYRSSKLNEMLRKKGHHVASRSQHSLGHAVDFRLVGMSPAEMKKQVIKSGWTGGIGQYDKESDDFVHADVGPQREWYEGRR